MILLMTHIRYSLTMLGVLQDSKSIREHFVAMMQDERHVELSQLFVEF